jgi:serine/threonine protein kinase
MKKLSHPNVVSLVEVLDDPEEDSLYMVMEMCKKGVVMKVGLEQKADPYDEERCRLWFRDMILGMEYCEFKSPHTRGEFSREGFSACSRHHSSRHQAGQLPDHI